MIPKSSRRHTRSEETGTRGTGLAAIAVQHPSPTRRGPAARPPMPLQAVPLSVLDILRSIPDSVLTIDRDKRVVALNGPAEALTGTSEVAVGGRPCSSVLHSEICDSERCPFER